MAVSKRTGGNTMGFRKKTREELADMNVDQIEVYEAAERRANRAAVVAVFVAGLALLSFFAQKTHFTTASPSPPPPPATTSTAQELR